MSAAITGRRMNKTVLLIESGTLGGTCVNVGCVPSKALLRLSGHRAHAAANPFAGAPFPIPTSETAYAKLTTTQQQQLQKALSDFDCNAETGRAGRPQQGLPGL